MTSIDPTIHSFESFGRSMVGLTSCSGSESRLYCSYDLRFFLVSGKTTKLNESLDSDPAVRFVNNFGGKLLWFLVIVNSVFIGARSGLPHQSDVGSVGVTYKPKQSKDVL